MSNNGVGYPLAMRRQIMSKNQPKGIGNIMKHCVAKYTFDGRTNADADRNTLYDSSGNENHMTLYNMSWGASYSDLVKEGYFNGALYLRPKANGGNSYGMVTLKTPLSEMTLIIKRAQYAINNNLNVAWCALIGSGYEPSNALMSLEYKNDSGIMTSQADGLIINERNSQDIVWMNMTHYCGKKLTGTAAGKVHDGRVYLNKLRGNLSINGGNAQKIECIYIFNKSLTPSEIKAVITTEIDATYVMPEIEE